MYTHTHRAQQSSSEKENKVQRRLRIRPSTSATGKATREPSRRFLESPSGHVFARGIFFFRARRTCVAAAAAAAVSAVRIAIAL